ncbi:MAG: DUF1836 domain-containing protein [Clostridia bacterium]|nr:DUF1836 domain-containing protein [Clostridia bacterium]
MNRIIDFNIPEENEIPTIPLYMDQVTGYLDDIFESQKRNEEEKILTKTMINNYVKAGLIESPDKKKYNEDQIKQLMIIYMLKSVLQIQEIETILKAETEVSKLYQLMVSVDKDIKANFKIPKGDTLQQVLELLLSAQLQKKYAETLLDQMMNPEISE